MAFSGDHIDANLVKVLISRLISLEKLHNDKLLGVNSGVMFCRINRNTQKKETSHLKIMYFGSKRTKNAYWEIYQEVVWFVESTILSPKQHCAFSHFR